MVTVTLPYNYWIAVERNRNYTLYKTVKSVKKDTKEEYETDRLLGYFSDFGMAIKQGYMKDLEATLEAPSSLSIEEYVKRIEEIENNVVSAFYDALKVNTSSDVLDEIL